MNPDGPGSRSAPLIAVLPIHTGEAPSEEALARMIREALIGELTRFGGIEVMAALSAETAGDLSGTEAALRLGADYVLTSRLLAAGAAPRLAVTLVAGADSSPVWHERLALGPDDPLAVIDEVTARLAATFSAQIFGDVLRRSRSRAPESLGDFELITRGLALLKTGTREADEAARELFERVLARDPQSPAALSGMALSWFNEWSCEFWDEIEETGRRAYDFAHRALAIDDRDPWVHLIIGRILIYRREFARAAWYVDRALALAPNDAELLIQLAPAEVYLGRPEAALAHVDKAMRLNPYHPNHYFAYATLPYIVARDFETALATAERATALLFVDVPGLLAICCAYLGKWDRARHYLASFDREFRDRITHGRPPEHGEAFAWLLAFNPFRRQEDIDLIAGGARLLGEGGHPGRDHWHEDGRRGEPAEAVLARDGGGWRVEFDGEGSALPDLKGLHDLARLLARPGEEFHSLDLTGRDEADSGEEVLDERGRQEVKRRIRELQEELAEAEDMNDIGRAERLRGEMDRLVDELARALGIGGRGRRMGDLAERARTTVTWRIRHAIRRVGKAHPPLGRHLGNSVRTGLFCAYRPERDIIWRIRDSA